MSTEDDQGPAYRSSIHGYPMTVDLLSSPSLLRAEATQILSSPDIMAELFRTRLSSLLPRNSTLIKCVPEVLMNRMRTRQIVSYRLVFSDTKRSLTLVLKRYEDKTGGKKIYSVMRMLWDNGFDRESKLRIPEPLFFLEDLGLLVLEKARGRQLRKYLNQSGLVARAHMKAVAKWLAKLHYLNVDLDEVSPHPDEEATIRAFVRQAGSREPGLLATLEKLASLILIKLSAFNRVPMTPVHGDFQCGNIFVAKDNVTVIDFDNFCRSDPARDLGYMIAQARATALRDAMSYDTVYSGLKAFWDEYLNTAPEEQTKTLSARASLFAARRCLQNIDYILTYMSPEDKMGIVNILLSEAELFSKTSGMEEALAIRSSS